jgi:hypothetical protein
MTPLRRLLGETIHLAPHQAAIKSFPAQQQIRRGVLDDFAELR